MIDQLDFSRLGGLVPAIVQQEGTGRVLMLGFMNAEALEQTISTGLVTFWSRSRNRLWVKGETSGNRLHVVSLHPDCDADTLLVVARADGPACHTGATTCFDGVETPTVDDTLGVLERTIARRREAMSESSYTASLFREGTERIAQKVGEEAVEVVIAALRGERGALAEEAADLLYHLLVLLAGARMSLADVTEVLRARMAPAVVDSR